MLWLDAVKTANIYGISSAQKTLQVKSRFLSNGISQDLCHLHWQALTQVKTPVWISEQDMMQVS